CSACGAATAERKEYQGQATGFLEAGQTVPVEVPVCAACQQAHTRAQHRGILVGLGCGVAGAVALAVLLALLLRDPRALNTAIPFAVMGAVIGSLIGNAVGKARASPVLLREYSPAQGTVLFWFRNSDYGDALLEILGGEEEGTPDPEDG